MIVEEYDEVIIPKGQSGGVKAFHIPEPGEDRPVCVTRGRNRDTDWAVKDSVIFPPGHFRECSRCVRIHNDTLES